MFLFLHRHTRRKTNNPLLLLSQKLEFIQPLPLDPLHRAGAPEPSSPEEPLISSGLESLTEEPESRTQVKPVKLYAQTSLGNTTPQFQ